MSEYAPQLKSSGKTDVYVAKYSPENQMLWALRIGGQGYDRVFSIALDNLQVIDCLYGITRDSSHRGGRRMFGTTLHTDQAPLIPTSRVSLRPRGSTCTRSTLL